MSEKSFSKNYSEISDAIGLAAEKGYKEFLSWFNTSDDVDRSFIRGAWDFSFYFANQAVAQLIGAPEEKRCLEIGYGGGRLLHASRSLFKHSYGIDIHPFADKVKKKLLERTPADDFSLFRLSEPKIPLENETVDYVYSFIVIQHFYDKSILEAYLDEAMRILKPGGILNLFFADTAKYHDKLSKVYLGSLLRGVMEIDFPPDDTTAHNTLWLSRGWISGALSSRGCTVSGWADSYKDVPDGFPDRDGSQSGVIAVKGDLP